MLSVKKILLIGIIVGIISGFAALLFVSGIELLSDFVIGNILGYHMPAEGTAAEDICGLSPPAGIWLILPILCIGALISGLIVYFFAPEAEGHGTDAALKSYHTCSKIRRRVPIVKAISSIITIGTGGSAGSEGPTAQISAGIGSIVADLLKLSAKERQIAVAVGIGSGIGTIFKAPLGGVILAAELLYLRDFEYKTIIPSFAASVVSYLIFGFFRGYTPLFCKLSLDWSVMQMPFFIALGFISAFIGLLYIKSFYGSKKIFDNIQSRFKYPKFLNPVIGAFIMGAVIVILCCASPESMLAGLGSLGTSYGFVQLTFYNMLPLSVLIILPFLKILTTSLTIGSGASGGVFAPGLAIGAFCGAAFGMIMHILFPEIITIESVPVFAIIGMISLFGGVSHAPIAVLMMVLEMTTDFSLLIPGIVSVMISSLILRNETIFKQQRVSKTDSRTSDDL